MRWLIALLLILAAPLAQAATVSDSDSPMCKLRLDGPIAAGDLQQLQARVAETRLMQGDDAEDFAICLNSPGGSLIEGIAIGDWFADVAIGTVIEAGNSCLSACAIIFMQGTRDDMADGEPPSEAFGGFGATFSRKMHITAKLGFHSPDIGVPTGQNFTGEQVKSAFTLAIDSALAFMQSANRWKQSAGGPAMRSDLMEQLLQHAGMDDFYYIDTVDKAGRWEIETFGWEMPDDISAREAVNACDNLSNWQFGLAPTPVINLPVADLPWAVSRPGSYIDYPLSNNQFGAAFNVWGRDKWVMENGLGEGERRCQVALIGKQLKACGGDFALGRSFNAECRDGFTGLWDYTLAVPQLAIFPSDTLLRDLPQEAARIRSEAAAVDATLIPSRDEGCLPPAGTLTVNVTRGRYAPVRAVPGLDNPYFASVQNGAGLVPGSEGPRVTEPAENQDACYNACLEMATEDNIPEDRRVRLQEVADQCIAANHIWWPVVLPDGREGWISAGNLR